MKLIVKNNKHYTNIITEIYLPYLYNIYKYKQKYLKTLIFNYFPNSLLSNHF